MNGRSQQRAVPRGHRLRLTLNSVLPDTARAPFTVCNDQPRSCANKKTSVGSSLAGLRTASSLYGRRVARTDSGVCDQRFGN